MKSNGKQYIYLLAMFFAVILIFIVPLQCQEVSGAERKTISLRDFSGGLNTNTNPFLLKENEFLQLHNFDITDEFGSISLRRGFRAVTDSFPRPTSDSINITLYVINRLAGSLPPLWPLGEELFTCSLLSVDYDLNIGGLWDNAIIRIVGSSPDTSTVVANYNPAPGSNIKFTVLTVYDSNKFDVGDVLYIAIDSTLASNDTGKVTGLYSYLDRSGRKFLAQITPGFASGGKWSALMLSQQGQYQPKIRLWPYIYKDETPIFATWKSHMFVALPRQRPLVFDGKRTVPLIPRAPGQLEIIPLATAGNINGIVRYTLLERKTNDVVVYAGDTVFSTLPGSGLSARIGYVSHEIEFNNENALLFGFPKSAPDSLRAGRADTLAFFLCRLRGRPFEGEQPFDSFFVIDSFLFTDMSIVDTLTYIDTVPDDSLGKANWPFIGGPRGIYPLDTAYVDSITKRNDSTFYIDSMFQALGGPTFVSHDTANNATAGAGPWWKGSKDENDSIAVVGVVYFTTLLDTLNGSISDSSPNLWVSLAKPGASGTSGGSDSTKSITIGIPPLTARDSGLVRILWRSRVLMSQVDELAYEVRDSIYITLEGIEFGRELPPNTFRLVDQVALFSEEFRDAGFRGTNPRATSNIRIVKGRVLGPRRARRNIPFAAYLITDPSQNTITDTLQWAELMGAGAGFTTTVGSGTWSPLDNRVSIFNGFYAYNDHLFGWVGSRLFRSALDTAFIFRPFKDVAFNLDDGDEIVQVVALGPNLLILKNRSIIELYDPIAGLPTKGSQNNGIGCIAPHSLVEGNGVIMFLSEHGVVTLKASQFQPFGIQTGIISQKINNLILGRSGNKRSAFDMKKAVGALVDDKYLLCFPTNTNPSNDTTFVYHIPLDAWTTYDFSFHQATKYDTFTVEGLVQSNRLLFARTDDERIFEFGGSPFYIDSGDANGIIAGVVETRPLFTDMDIWQFRDIVMMRSSGAGNGQLYILNEDGTELDNKTVSLTTSINAQRLSFLPNHFTWGTVRYNTGAVFGDSLIIKGLDITAWKRGRLVLR